MEGWKIVREGEMSGGNVPRENVRTPELRPSADELIT